MRHTSDICHRSREYISRRLDDDLAEFELVALRLHLVSCDECRSLAASMEAQTTALRAAPLQPVLRPMVVSKPRRVRIGSVSAVAVTVAVAAGIASAVTQLGPSQVAAPPALAAAPLSFEQKEIVVRRASLVAMAARTAHAPPPAHQPDAYGRANQL